MSTKMIRTTTLISLVSGKALSPFNEIHEAAEWVMGHSVWTHEFADKALWQQMRDVVLSKYPQLSVSVEHINSGNYHDEIPKIEAMFPPTLAVEQGVQDRTEDPTDSFVRIVNKAKGATMTPTDRAAEAISRLTAWLRDYGHEKQKPFVDDLTEVLHAAAIVAELQGEIERLRANLDGYSSGFDVQHEEIERLTARNIKSDEYLKEAMELLNHYAHDKVENPPIVYGQLAALIENHLGLCEEFPTP